MAQRAPGAGGSSSVVQLRSGKLALRHMEGVQTPIIDFVKGHLPAYIRARLSRDGVTFSVGIRDLFVVPKGGGVLKLPQEGVAPLTVAGPALPEPVIVQDQTPISGNLPIMNTLRDFLGTGLLTNEQWNRATRGDPGSPSEIAALKAKAAPVQAPKTFVPQPVVIRETPIPTTPPIIPKPSTGGSMDLGSIITDLGTAYIKTKYAPSPTFVGLVAATPAYNVGDLGGDIIDFFTDPATGTVVSVKKKKPCRRRRRRLATKSDLGDLAALKAILGNGEAFKAWIATHSR